MELGGLDYLIILHILIAKNQVKLLCKQNTLSDNKSLNMKYHNNLGKNNGLRKAETNSH